MRERIHSAPRDSAPDFGPAPRGIRRTTAWPGNLAMAARSELGATASAFVRNPDRAIGQGLDGGPLQRAAPAETLEQWLTAAECDRLDDEVVLVHEPTIDERAREDRSTVHD